MRVPYTHWLYFASREAADRCANELRVDHRVRVDRVDDEHTDRPWLLRAAGMQDLDVDRDPVEEAARRHGGAYDGGESTFVLAAGEFVPEPGSENW